MALLFTSIITLSNNNNFVNKNYRYIVNDNNLVVETNTGFCTKRLITKIENMKYRKTRINNQDFVISQHEGESEHQIVAYEFVKKLLLGVSQHFLKFYSTKYDFVDFPFTYRERQLDSLILPCISFLCNGIAIAEYPVSRNCKHDDGEKYDTQGRIDYWCIYKGFTFVIEVKHSYDYIHEMTN